MVRSPDAVAVAFNGQPYGRAGEDKMSSASVDSRIVALNFGDMRSRPFAVFRRRLHDSLSEFAIFLLVQQCKAVHFRRPLVTVCLCADCGLSKRLHSL